MATLVLTVVGADRAGIVSAVAEVVGAHGGNWENSQLAELSGTFAGVIEVAVSDARADELREALTVLEGLVTVVVSGRPRDADARRRIVVRVLGNDRAGIVREVTSVLAARGVNIDRMTTQTKDAAMAGGRLFEASLVATAPADLDDAAVIAALEGIAVDLQVEASLASEAS